MVIRDDRKRYRESEVTVVSEEIICYAAVYEAMNGLVETMLHKLKKNESEPFLMILLTAHTEELESLLKDQKRPSDILVKIEDIHDHYAIMCQNTNIEGGFSFTERLMRYLKTGFAEGIYCTVMDVRSGTYSAGEIIFEMIDLFREAVREKRSGEVILRSLK